MDQAWGYSDFVKDALTRVKEVSCEELAQRLGQPETVVLDVREPDECGTGTLPGAVLLPRGLLEKHAHEHLVRRDTPTYVYCDTGNRSALVADTLQRMGFTRVFNLGGGLERWRHQGLPLAGVRAPAQLPGARLDWEAVRREFAIVNRRVPVVGSAERPLVYMDHAASTHPPATVLAAYVEFMERDYSNIHRGTHHLSRKASERFDECYHVVADFIGAELKRGCVAFTANTTQAIDLASHVMAERPGKVVTTELEHHSNELPHRRRGPVLRARVTDTGELDMEHLEHLLRHNEVKLVAVTAGSNVTGFMPDLPRIARMAHENGALVLVDAAQALARMPLDVRPFEHPEHLDFVVGAGHKAYAPFGAGFLYGPRALMDEAPPYVPGGGTAAIVSARSVEYVKSPDRHQGGTPNIAGVVAMARALQFLKDIGMEEVRRHEVALLRRALEGLQKLGGVTLYGAPEAERRLGVVSFNVDGVSDLLTAAVLSEEGAIAVRNGRFCAHMYVDRLLAAQAGNSMSAQGERPTGAVRASVGLYNCEADVDRLLEFVQRVRDRKWVGRYRVSGNAVSAEFAGRCADRWMESTQEGESAQPEPSLAAQGYAFEVLQPEEPCRTYLIADPETREAALVDPLLRRVDDYVELLSEKGWTLKYVVETHSHADHLSGAARLKQLTGATLLMHAGAPVSCVDRGLVDGDVIQVGSVRMEVLTTPGHTNDGVCLVLPGRVLTGDTLLIGGCGRTDLPTGDAGSMFDSLQRLLQLPDDTLVLPAHDYDGRRASTIGRERTSNRRLQHPSADAFRTALAEGGPLPVPRGFTEVLSRNQNCLLG
ncbi:MAG: aminotransferase class V-fold PLP-dependent enzyme [Myxococcaceae bacterium]|nr:aminotransferase class V-fold PLP-dependent enzyme [Myxococcaceae bacterium]MCI0671369.1 aminotransferase class V-fold PLP-dependent enzyme [Myxococcaceae bacterium]